MYISVQRGELKALGRIPEEDSEKTEETNAENTENNEENVTETANSENYFEQARLNKENSRSKSLEILNQTAECSEGI